MPAMLAGKKHLTCPRRLILDEPRDFFEALNLYNLYDKGVLAVAGGVSDQPAIYMDLMRCIGSAVGEVESELSRRAESGGRS